MTDEVPVNCPGPDSEGAGKRDACAGCPNQTICSSGAASKPDADVGVIAQRLSKVKHTILVLSGKGGVGKSTVASQLAFSFASDEQRDVGLLDIDICGPSIPKMLGLEGEDVHQSAAGWSPVYVSENLGVMSIGFILPNRDDAVIWRGPRKNALIKQFLKDVDWGPLDVLIIDAPPGTSDEHISIAQYLKATTVDGALIVTTPQDVALVDVRKEINFCKKVGIPVLGVVENMSRLVQSIDAVEFYDGDEDVTPRVLAAIQAALPQRQITVRSEILDATKGGGRALADEMHVEFLGSIPMDPNLGRASETGMSIMEVENGHVPSAAALKALTAKVKTLLDVTATTRAL